MICQIKYRKFPSNVYNFLIPSVPSYLNIFNVMINSENYGNVYHKQMIIFFFFLKTIPQDKDTHKYTHINV